MSFTTFDDDLTIFYQRWHAYERSLGPKGGLVIDFDMAARPPDTRWQPYESREEALDALEAVAIRAEQTSDLVNPEYIRQRLQGSECYLRALMGERFSFWTAVKRMMGVYPAPLLPDELSAQGDAARQALDARGIPWSTDGRDVLRQRFGLTDLSGFDDALRGWARTFVDRLRARVPETPDPAYRIELAHEDAYWANWIDGSVSYGVTLKVNTHPRAAYDRFSPMALAAHEIAGHAAHVAALRHGATEAGGRRVDPSALNLTVHSCEAFQMEGLAQAMLHILTEPDELDPDLRALELYRGYAGERVNAAQLDVVEGRPIDEVCAALLADCPLSRPLSLRSDLRDRSRDPLYRAYVFVYPPSRRTFRKIAELPRPRQDELLREMLFGLFTPAQIQRRIERAHRETDGTGSST